MNSQQQYQENHRVNNDGVIERRCSNPECKEWKEENVKNFYIVNKKAKVIKFMPECKMCSKKRSLQTRNENLERSRQTKQDWYDRDNNAKKVKTYNRDYYLQNPEKKLQIASEFRKNNKDVIKRYVQNKSQHGTHTITVKEWKACKEYFNNECAYCGLPVTEHYGTYRGVRKLFDFHKEHAIHKGSNGLDNCLPSCGQCNSEKNVFSIDEWYNKGNIKYLQQRYDKIQKWLNEDYKKYIIVRKKKVDSKEVVNQ